MLFAVRRLDVRDRARAEIRPKGVEPKSTDGVGAVGDGRSLVEVLRCKVDHNAAAISPPFDEFPDYLLPRADGPARFGRVEVEEGVAPRHFGREDQHVACQQADVEGMLA